MTFSVEWSEDSVNQLAKLEALLAKRIAKKVKEFSQGPFSKDIKKLKGLDSYCLRVGDYRVIFDILVNERKIRINKVGHRKNIYDRI